jgi:hypothetical protein
MANVTSTKQAATLTANEAGLIKKEIVIDWEDINDAGTYADNDTATFTIDVKAGQMIKDVAVKLVTAFDDSGAGDELNVEVGATDVDGYIATAALHTDQTEISYVANTGALLDNENGVVVTADDTIDILITPNVSTGTDYSLNELTAGEFVVKAWILDLR